MSTLKPSEILDKAADHIERHGWIQNDWYLADLGRPVSECAACGGGAINIVAGLDPCGEDDPECYDDATITALEAMACHVDEELREHYANGGREELTVLLNTIAEWNDSDDRTAEQVIAALRECAANLRKEGQ